MALENKSLTELIKLKIETDDLISKIKRQASTMADDQGFSFEDDDPTWCRSCRLFMTFLCMSGTEQVWFEDWKCLKCGDIVQIEVTPKSSGGFIDDLLLD